MSAVLVEGKSRAEALREGIADRLVALQRGARDTRRATIVLERSPKADTQMGIDVDIVAMQSVLYAQRTLKNIVVGGT